MRLWKTLAASTVAVLLIAGSGAARAGLLAYDGFADGGASPGPGQYRTSPPSTNGKDNDSLYGQGPVLTGFSAADTWTGAPAAFAAHVYFRAEGGGLSYTDGLGHALEATAGQVNLFRTTAGTHDKLIGRASSNSDVPPATLYFSGLIEFSPGREGLVRTKWGSKTSIGIGFDNAGNAVVTTGSTARGTSAAAFAAGTTHFVVGKIIEGGGGGWDDAVTLYVDPTDLTAEAANTPTLSNVDLGSSYYTARDPSYDLSNVYLFGDTGASSSVLFDELRVGQTWADVAPVVGGLPAPTILRFQQGVSPTPAYVADSTTVRSDRATTPQDNDPDGENIIGRVGSAFMRGLFEFDVSEIEMHEHGGIEGVELIMTTRTTAGGQGGELTVNLYQYGYDFAEAVATWDDPDGDGDPATGDTTPGGTLGALLTSATFSPTTTNMTVTFPSTPALLAAVMDALAANDNTLRLIATRDVETGSGNHFVRFWDEEYAGILTYRPELVVTLAPIPEPATLTLVALGGLGLWLRRRRGAH